MDQKRIGAFIAQCRKENNLTQIQLAEKLGLTNQAVSKWETGKGMPDMALLQPLCDALGISLNELFSGQHLSEDEYKKKAEENISELFKEKQLVNLKPVKYLFAICANVTLLVAAVELIVGIIGYFFNPNLLGIMLINALVWLVLFIPCMMKVVYDRNKLKKLKQTGIRIDAEIKDILPIAWVRVGSYISCRIDCHFCYEDKEYTALSSYYILTPFKLKEDLCVSVYVDKNNHDKYAVEVLQK